MTPTGEIWYEYEMLKLKNGNPVTISVLRDILRQRLNEVKNEMQNRTQKV